MHDKYQLFIIHTITYIIANLLRILSYQDTPQNV